VHDRYQDIVRDEYRRSAGDFTALFRQVLAIAEDIGSDAAWKLLEKCVIEKRLAWLDANPEVALGTGDSIVTAYLAFYERYLGVRTPGDGEIVESTGERLVTRWWNHCPTLEACKKLGLDTREVCRKAYHQPVQVFLSRIDPRLRFERNYDALRPQAPYCEEMILMAGD
jgi:hypothetical protein